MFDTNEFKKSVKEWMRDNPRASEEELRDLCEDLIPSAMFTRYQWLIDHTVSWYRHILAQRKDSRLLVDEADEVAA